MSNATKETMRLKLLHDADVLSVIMNKPFTPTHGTRKGGKKKAGAGSKQTDQPNDPAGD